MKRVLIAGGGIGGMQAALTCAQRGHTVILCEKSGALGGAIRCERDVPFKRKLDMYIRSQAAAVKKAGIDLRLHTEVTPSYAEAVGVDVIIAALGAKPVRPGIAGIDGKNVMGAEEAYINPDQVGEKTVILGAGLVGLELAVYLAMLGRQVTVVEMADKINDGGNMLHAEGLQLELKKRGIRVDLNTKALEIKNGGAVCSVNGQPKLYEADTVIYAVGQKPLQDEALSLRFCAPEFYMLGDCITPRNIYGATSTAYDIARNLGRY